MGWCDVGCYDTRMTCFFFLMIRRPPRSTQSRSSAASDVYKRQTQADINIEEVHLQARLGCAFAYGLEHR